MLEDIKLFVQIVDSGGFSSAAKTLNLHPATLSKKITALENDLGFMLFEEDKHNLNLTQQGQKIYNQSKNSIYALDSKFNNIKSKSSQIGGKLTVVLPPILSRNAIMPKLPSFLEKYPDIQLDLHHISTDVSNLNIQFDLAVTSSLPQKEFFLVKSIYTYHGVLCATQNYIEQHGRPQTIHELSQHKVGLTINLLNNHTLTHKIKNFVTGEIFDYTLPKAYLQSDITDEVLSLVQANICIGGISNLHVSHLIQNNVIVNLFPDYAFGNYTFYMVRPNIYKSKMANIFEEFLLNCVREYDLTTR